MSFSLATAIRWLIVGCLVFLIGVYAALLPRFFTSQTHMEMGRSSSSVVDVHAAVAAAALPVAGAVAGASGGAVAIDRAEMIRRIGELRATAARLEKAADAAMIELGGAAASAPVALAAAVSAPLTIAAPTVVSALPAQAQTNYAAGGLQGHPLLAAWHAGNVDWHNLVRKLPDGSPVEFLEDAERETLDYATGRMLRWHDYGPLARFSGCDILRDCCMVHGSAAECMRNEMCGWCPSTSICFSRENPVLPELVRGASERSCAETLQTKAQPSGGGGGGQVTLVSGGVSRSATPSQCKIVVQAPVVFVGLNGRAGMLYHFLSEFYVSNFARIRGEKCGTNVHIAFKRGFRFNKNSRGFFSYFQLLSQYCVRKIDDIPDGTCFQNVIGRGAMSGGNAACVANAEDGGGNGQPGDYKQWIVHRFGLDQLPPLEKAAIGFMSRRMKRVVLNEDELIVAMRARGLNAELLHLEDMPLYQQVASMKSISVLIGIHGSGLMNAQWMRAGGVSVQLLQCKMDEGAFRGSIDVLRGAAQSAGVHYFEWKQSDPTKCRAHWHFMGGDYAGRENEVMSKGPACCDSTAFFEFFVNQDIYIEPSVFLTDVVDRALGMVTLRSA